jgi:hypothetical protein
VADNRSATPEGLASPDGLLRPSHSERRGKPASEYHPQSQCLRHSAPSERGEYASSENAKAGTDEVSQDCLDIHDAVRAEVALKVRPLPVRPPSA